MATTIKYKRILLKLSGEGLMGKNSFGLDNTAVASIALKIKEVNESGVEICIVVGGGNIFRGIAGAAKGMDRASADYMGMLATVINALAVQNSLERIGVNCRVQSAIPMDTVSEPYIRRRAVRHMEKGRVVIFAAGTGNPFFTTDTAAALRTAEMGCDILLKATNVDGVYSMDPYESEGAKRYKTITYTEVLQQKLRVMDASAIALMRESNIPVLVFNMHEKISFTDILSHKGSFTIISGD